MTLPAFARLKMEFRFVGSSLTPIRKTRAGRKLHGFF